MENDSMSQADVPNPISTGDSGMSFLSTRPEGKLATWMDWVVEQFSSILVKEARQSLKSFQFYGTYSVLILAIIAWTAFALTMVIGDSSAGERFASTLLCGYLVILGLPLAVIVPFSAFRSLSREYEDGTIQLVSITTMKPYQIVIGKLATAMLQMVIYLSVVAPCIAFISMLDGVSYLQILMGLVVPVIACFLFTVIGLLLAGASRSYSFTMAISTMFVLALGGMFILWVNFVGEVIYDSWNMNSMDRMNMFEISTYTCVSFALTSALVILAAAASQISFVTDNRSTLVRVAMLLQLPFFFGSLVILASVFANPYDQIEIYFLVFVGHYWLFLGCLLVGESGEMSRRVLRGMPRSPVDKCFRSLLMPGPGRGYLFAMSCMFSCAIVVIFMKQNWEWFILDQAAHEEMMTNFANLRGVTGATHSLVSTLTVFVVLMAYPAFFLSLTYLLMELYRRYAGFRASGAIGPVVAVLVGSFILFSLSMFSVGLAEWDDWDIEQVKVVTSLNWYYVISVASGQMSYQNDFDLILDLLLVGPFLISSILLTVVAFFVAAQELRYRPLATPQRVTQDLEKIRESVLPKGESIDEILGLVDETDADEAL